jgi:hypothetical protein
MLGLLALGADNSTPSLSCEDTLTQGPGLRRHSQTLAHGEFTSLGYLPLTVQTRDLKPEERAVLDLLLTRRFPGRNALLDQAKTVRTAGLSCTWGCPSFSLAPDRTLQAAELAKRMPTDAHGTDPGGNEVGVLLLVDDGYLAEVEVSSFGEDEFAGLPAPAR